MSVALTGSGFKGQSNRNYIDPSFSSSSSDACVAGVAGDRTPVSNTRGSNFADGLRLLRRCVDWVEYTFSLSEDELHERLAFFADVLGSEIELGGFKCLVSRSGGLHPWSVAIGPVRVLFPDLGCASRRVRVIAPSDAVADADASMVDSYLRDMCSRMFLFDMAGRDWQLSRADMAMDILLPASSADGLFRVLVVSPDIVVTRGRDRGVYARGSRFTGWYVGRGDIRLRCYDKAFEAASHRDLSDWLGRWSLDGVPDGFRVVRLEWQLRRDFLRSRGVATLDDLLSGASNILRYLMGEWFRLAAPPSGKFHKRATLGCWQLLLDLFADGVFSGADGGLKVRRVPRIDPGMMLSQAMGCLKHIAALAALEDGSGELLPPSYALAQLRAFMTRRYDRWKSSVAQAMYVHYYGVGGA